MSACAPARLCDFLRDHQQEILLAWEKIVGAEPAASGVSKSALRDHLPQLLDRVAGTVENIEDRQQSLEGIPGLHALTRLDLGYDLGAVIVEYSALRACVFSLYAASATWAGHQAEAERFHACIDEAIRLSVSHYTMVRNRTLLALDQVSQAALDGDDLSGFLPRLLRVMVDNIDAVDMGAIFLLEEGRLRVGASVGMLEDFSDLTLGIGEGFAGQVAAQRKPLEFRSVGGEGSVKPRGLPADTKALFGVPLIDQEQLVGVAYMGSRTAFEFAPGDTILLRVTASRAAAFIVQAGLRQAERLEGKRARAAEARLLQTAEFRETFLGVVAHDLRNFLQTIMGTSHVMLGAGRVGERDYKMVSRILHTSELMNRLINDLLDFTRGRLGGGIPAKLSPGDMGLICSRVVGELQAAYPEREFRLSTQGDVCGLWDGDRMTQAVMNLCANAHQYGKADSPISVAVEGHQDLVTVAVENEGQPIPPEQLTNIFEPYRRGPQGQSRVGLGLGLFIVREVALAHGGTATVQQQDGRVVFMLRLPRRSPEAPTA